MSLETVLEKNQQRYVDELSEFLRIPSVSARSEHRQDTAHCADWLAERLREVGMTAEVIATKGHPIVLGEHLQAGNDAPTVLVYGHYDVQPVEPLDEWATPPFEPSVRDGRLYARGSVDDKGQVYMHVKALEAYRESQGDPPVNLKYVFEGEEEVGSENLEDFLRRHAKRLACDVAVISDTPMLAPDLPAVCVGLRGLAYMEVRLSGPSQDLHSGGFGGAITNPANALCEIIANLKDENGRVTIPGFYDEVVAPTEAERRAYSDLPFSEDNLRREAGVKALGDGEAGYHFLERIWARPTLDVNGILSGYTREGAKTIIPATAMAKISMRLVPEQNPQAIADAFEEHVRSLVPQGVEIEIERHSFGLPWTADPEGPVFQAASAAVEATFGRAPLFTREGGSIPIVPLFEQVLEVPVLLLGFALPGSNLHSPNEWISLDLYHKGIETLTRLFGELAEQVGKRG